MTARQLVVVGLRFFSIWLCIKALQAVVYLANLRHADGLGQAAPSMYYMIGFLLSAAVVVWMTARQLAGAVLSGVPVNDACSPSLANLVAAGCVLMGLWWLKDAVAGLADSWVKAQVLAATTGQSAFSSMALEARVRTGYFLGEGLAAAVLVGRPFAVTRRVLRLSANPPHRDPLQED